MPRTRDVLGHVLTPWQARALYALTDDPTTACGLLNAAQYAKANSLYPHQRHQLHALAPALLTISPGPHGPLYARTDLGRTVAQTVFPDPPSPPQRGGHWPRRPA